MTTRRRFLNLAAAALATPALPRLACAQSWPARPIRAMIPFSAGSSLDIVGRIVLDPLSSQLGQTIVVENRGGAGGTIGTAAVAKADPDGYTLLINASAHSAAPAAYPNIAYDPARDFSAVIPFGTVPNVTLVAPGQGHQDHPGARGRRQIGLAQLRLRRRRQRHPLGGGAPARQRRVPGRARAVPRRSGSAHRGDDRSGRFHLHGHVGCAAVHSRRQAHPAGGELGRSGRPRCPTVPTTLEAGLADSDYNYWMGMFVPAKTPREIVERLYQETQKALRLPAVVEKFGPQGIEPMPMTSAEFDALIKKEIAINIALVKAAGLKFN